MKKSSLRDTHPHLFAELHPVRNADLIEDDVASYSNKKVWWVHRTENGDLHEWRQIVRNRAIEGSGCSTCSQRRAAGQRRRTFSAPALGRSLAEREPAHAALWHPDWNADLTPRDVTYGSERRVWWRCPDGHAYIRAINSQTSGGRGCGVCERADQPGRPRTRSGVRLGPTLAEANPGLAAEWHPTKNADLSPADVAASSTSLVWWRAACGHIWRAHINVRHRNGTGCRRCRTKGAGQRFVDAKTADPASNSLAAKFPDVAARWHPTLNGDVTPQTISYGNAYRAWWLCPNGHSTQRTVNQSTARSRGCWVCANPARVPAPEFGFSGRAVAEASERAVAWWHPWKNGSATPDLVAASSAQKVWLLCPENHEIQTSASAACNEATGCRPCSNRADRARRAEREHAATADLTIREAA